MQKFICEKCDYITSHKNDYNRHCLTVKHRVNKNDNIVNPVCTETIFTCQNCDKGYNSHVGLWKHAKKCPKNVQKQDPIVDILLKQNEMLIHKTTEMQQQHNDQINLLLKKDDDLKAIILDICKNSQTLINNQHTGDVNTITNSTVNSNNKTFNLQFFLNETCKDALNLSDFIRSVQSSCEDIETIGNMGYVDGTSSFIIKHLNELGVERRPIQCTDAKRQTLYIKENDQWNKEEPDFRYLQVLVDEVQKINLRVLPLWQKTHPNCLTSTSRFTDTYNHMSQELMGGECHKVKLHVKDNKIFNKIIKEVVIDKQLFSK